MIKNYARGEEYIPPTVEKMLNVAPYEKDRAEALKWFQENLRSPTFDERAGRVSHVHTSDERVTAVSVGYFCGIRVKTGDQVGPNSFSTLISRDIPMSPTVMKELASALLICAERAEHPDHMIAESKK